jgi:acetyl esterase
MKNNYDIHPDYQRLPTLNLSFKGWIVALLKILMTLSRWFKRNKSGVSMERPSIPRPDGSKLGIIKMTPPGIARPAPCLLYYHGGGFALTYGAPHISMCQRYAKATGCYVIFVDYRLMPAHPFPAGQDDSHTALQWVVANAESLGIDKARIAVMGDSAGGALSASVCQMSQVRDTANICAQLLIYPVTDMDCKTQSAREFTDTPIFTSKSNSAMWQAYLRNCAPGAIPPYASPIHREDLRGLPAAYVETAEFDPLHDEGVNYARRLEQAGVDVVLNDTKRTVHGYDATGSGALGEDAMGRRVEYLRNAFAGGPVESA